MIAVLISGCNFAMSTSPQASNVWLQPKKTEIVAHRGGAGHWPDNSLEAFRNAASVGSTAVEMDVHSTMDGVQVLNHANFIRVDGVKYLLEDCDYARLKALKPDLCTLEEALAVIADTDLKLLLEIKAGSDIAHCVDAVHKYGLHDRTAFISFSKRRLKSVREYDPTAAIGFIFGKLPEGLDDTISELDLSMICQRYVHLTQSDLSKWHDMGLHVNIWTVNQDSDMAEYLAWGVDSITTDYPDRASAVIDEQ